MNNSEKAEAASQNAAQPFLQKPGVVSFVSIACLALSLPFAGTAVFLFEHKNIFFMWCNVFWVVFLLGVSISVRWLGIQRTLALSLLLIALIFLGTSGVWLQMGKWILVVFNFFWAGVFLAGAFWINPRRSETRVAEAEPRL